MLFAVASVIAVVLFVAVVVTLFRPNAQEDHPNLLQNAWMVLTCLGAVAGACLGFWLKMPEVSIAVGFLGGAIGLWVGILIENMVEYGEDGAL